VGLLRGVLKSCDRNFELKEKKPMAVAIGFFVILLLRFAYLS